MRRLTWVLGLAFFFLNPALACGPADPEFQYGAEEMRGAVEGNWALQVDSDGKSTAVTVRLQQDTAVRTALARPAGAGVRLVRAAHACGTRTLVKSAGACSDSTQMPLVATYVSGDAGLAAMTGTGSLTIHSLTFDVGYLYLKFGGYEVEAQVDAHGNPSNPHLLTAGSQGATVTLARAN